MPPRRCTKALMSSGNGRIQKMSKLEKLQLCNCPDMLDAVLCNKATFG